MGIIRKICRVGSYAMIVCMVFVSVGALVFIGIEMVWAGFDPQPRLGVGYDSGVRYSQIAGGLAVVLGTSAVVHSALGRGGRRDRRLRSNV